MSGASQLSSIVILGGPLQIWSAAVLLSREISRDVSLTLLETEDPAAAPVLSFDSDIAFHHRADISELELVAQCDGNLSLGQLYSGWRGEGTDFFDAPAGTLPALKTIAIHHHLLRAATARGEPAKLPELAAAFRFPALAAMNGKFTYESNDPQSPRSMLRPIIHVDARAYTDLLRRKAEEARDIRHVDATGEIEQTEDSAGGTQALLLPDGEKIEADLFVDMRAQAITDPDPDIVSAFPFDRVVVESAEGTGQFTQIEALDFGVSYSVPLRTHIAKLLFFNAADLGKAGEPMSAGAREAKIDANFSRAPWRHNMVRIGPAAGSLGPLHDHDAALLHYQLLRLVEMLPASTDDMAIEASEFNQLCAINYQQHSDFIALPFVLNGLAGEFWDTVRTMKVSPNLDIRMEQFASRGRFVTFDGEVYDEQRWIDMMIGFGMVPQRFDPMLEGANMEKAGQALGRMVDAFRQTIGAMPSHADYMNKVVSLAETEAPVDEFAL